MFDRALQDAGIDRATTYVTNAVKHFKWEPRGKRRLHKRPNNTEVWACKPWLEAELEAIKPHALVCLGAVAAQSLLGNAFRVTEQRGKLLVSQLAPVVMATVHPSSILRTRTSREREQAYAQFVADLKQLHSASS